MPKVLRAALHLACVVYRVTSSDVTGGDIEPAFPMMLTLLVHIVDIALVSVEISHVNKLSSRQYGPVFRRMLGCV